MITEVDLDKDGKITFEEFIGMMKDRYDSEVHVSDIYKQFHVDQFQDMDPW